MAMQGTYDEGPIEAVKHKPEPEQEGAAALARWCCEIRKDNKRLNNSKR